MALPSRTTFLSTLLRPISYCPICHAPITDPVTTPCDHTFCRECLTAWAVEARSCAYCRRELFVEDERDNESEVEVAERQIESFRAELARLVEDRERSERESEEYRREIARMRGERVDREAADFLREGGVERMIEARYVGVEGMRARGRADERVDAEVEESRRETERVERNTEEARREAERVEREREWFETDSEWLPVPSRRMWEEAQVHVQAQDDEGNWEDDGDDESEEQEDDGDDGGDKSEDEDEDTLDGMPELVTADESWRRRETERLLREEVRRAQAGEGLNV